MPPVFFRILILFALILFNSCIIRKPVIVLKSRNKIQLDTIHAFNDVEILCRKFPARNFKNPEILDSAALFIYNEFKKLNCKVYFQDYNADNKNYKNIIAVFNENAEETIILGAHYDVNGDIQGADDNASGIAGLLGVARLFDSQKYPLKYRYEFIAYSTEETTQITIPMGSRIHAQSLKNQKANIKLMICMDMIGYYSEEPNSQDSPYDFMKWFYPTKANFVLITSKFGQGNDAKRFKKKMKKQGNIKIRSINLPGNLNGLNFSDHGNYWLFGYNAILVNNTSYFRNDNYHEKTDTIETLNYTKLTELIKSMYFALIHY